MTPRNSWCKNGDINPFWRLGGLAVQIYVSLALGVPLTDGFMDGMMGIR